MSKEEIGDAVMRLKEIKQEISDLVKEAGEIVKGCDYGEWAKALSNWITTINSGLRGKREIVNMDDTIEALEAMGEIHE